MPGHKVINLKNGKKIYLRSIRRSDVDEIWDIFENCLNEGIIFPKYIRLQSESEYGKLNWYHNLKLNNNISMIAKDIDDDNNSSDQKSTTEYRIFGLCIIENVEWDAAGHVGKIYTLIRKENRKLGLGTELIRFSFKEAKKMGKTKIIASVNSKNNAAIQFYQKIGFEQIGCRKKQFKMENQYFDEIMMDIWL